jgi:hypothetical protein
MSKAEKEEKSMAWPRIHFHEKPLEKIIRNSPDAEDMVIPATFFV